MGVRIIGGELKGRRLYSIRGTAVRPTADRLRESIFNIISSCVPDAVVLDLFSGTGALGIEALSRGAESAVFIDNSKEALSVIKNNIELCDLDKRARLIKWDIKRNLNCLKSTQPSFFTLVFLDPPYNQSMIEPTLFNLDLSRSMKKEAVIVVEHAPFESIPREFAAFEVTGQRRYGKTLVSLLKYVV
jgi:16S rRNA (guanine966-N2)-methyltransferase